MKRFLKIIGGFLFSLFVLLFLFVLFLPQLVNLEGIRHRVEQEAGKRLKAQVKVAELRLALLPRPGLRLSRLEIEAPRYHLRVTGARLAFRLRPLLHKQIEVYALVLEQPDLEVRLKSGKTPAKSWRTVLNQVLAHIPLISLKATNGTLCLRRGERVIFEGQGLSLRSEIRPDQILLEMEGRSQAFAELALSLKFWPKNGFLEGRTEVRHLDLSLLPLRTAYPLLGQLKTDLSLEVSYRREEDTWHLGFKGTAPCILREKARKLLFSCSAFLGEARLEPHKKWIKIHQIVMKDPELVASGNFSLTPEEAFLYVKIDQGDFAGWRARLLPLAKRNRRLSRFFSILTAAKVREGSVESRGATLKDLRRLENLTISAKVQDAVVNLPFLDDDLRIDSGSCRLYQRSLFVEEATGSYKGNNLSHGRLELYLFDRDRPFLFEADLKAQAPEALAVVKRLIKKERFQEAFAKIEDIQGEASGHLRVEGSLRHPQVSFRLRPQPVSFTYRDFPFPLTLSQGEIIYHHRVLSFQGLTVTFPKSRLESLSGALDFHQSPFRLQLEEARGPIFIPELNTLLEKSTPLKEALSRNRLKEGTLVLKKAFYQGPLSTEAFKKGLVLEGQAQNLGVIIEDLPAELKVLKGPWRYDRGNLSFGPAEVHLLDAKGIVSGEISPLLASKHELTLQGQATLGPKFLSWLYRKAALPPELYPVPPLKVSHLELTLGRKILLQSRFHTAKGALVEIDLRKRGKRLQLSSARFSVGKRTFELGLSLTPARVSFSCRGELLKDDWALLFQKPWVAPGRVKAHLRGTYYPQDLTRSEVWGDLTLFGLKVSLRGLPLVLQELRAKGRGSRISLSQLRGRFDHASFRASGEWEFAPRNIRFTGSMEAPYLDLNELLSRLTVSPPRSRPSKKQTWPPVVLKLDTRAGEIVWHRFRFQDFHGTLFYFERHWQIVVERASFCGINLVGGIDWSRERRFLRVSYYRKAGDLQKFLICALGQDRLAEGTFTLEGTFQGQGRRKPFLEKTSGKFFFSSPKGRIYKLGLLVKLFSFLNPFEIFSSNLPDLSKEGFSYDLLEIKGHFEKHDLVIDAAQLKGTGLRIFASGKIDLQSQKVRLTALISPFAKIDSMVSRLPVVGWVLTGKAKTFFSIPVEIRGSLAEPEIIPLDPRAVSKKLLGILGRTLQLPVKLFFPGENPPVESPGSPREKANPGDK